MRIISILIAAISLLWTMQVRAATCSEVIDAANEANESWWEQDGSEALIYVDGSKMETPKQLADTLRLLDRGPRNATQLVPIVVGGEFNGWDFSTMPAPLGDTCFYQSKMEGSKWDGGEYPGIGFIESKLIGSSFTGAKLDGVLLRQNDLSNVNMKGASLVGGLMDGGWDGEVENLDLSGADMRNFVFECGISMDDGCALSRDGIKMVGANLKGADISTFALWEAAPYKDAIIYETIISPRQIADLAQAKIEGRVILRGGDITTPINWGDWPSVAAAASTRDAPSFDCAKAGSDVEHMICADGSTELRHLDRQLAKLYPAALAKDKTVAKSQKQWLASRGTCIDDLCLIDSYTRRLGVLAGIAAIPPLAKAGDAALYVDEVVRFDEGFRRTELYAGLIPVLAGASMIEVLVERDANGTYSAMGSAVGANAHICSLGVEGMTLDKKTGWYGVKKGKGFVPVLRFAGDELEVIDAGHPTDEHKGANDYVSCGARAIFDGLRRIDADAATMAREKAALEGEGDFGE